MGTGTSLMKMIPLSSLPASKISTNWCGTSTQVQPKRTLEFLLVLQGLRKPFNQFHWIGSQSLSVMLLWIPSWRMKSRKLDYNRTLVSLLFLMSLFPWVRGAPGRSSSLGPSSQSLMTRELRSMSRKYSAEPATRTLLTLSLVTAPNPRR